MSKVDGLQFSKVSQSFDDLYFVVAEIENGEVEEIIKSLDLLDGVIVEGERLQVNQIVQALDPLYAIVIKPQAEYIVVLRDSLRNNLQEPLILQV